MSSKKEEGRPAPSKANLKSVDGGKTDESPGAEEIRKKLLDARNTLENKTWEFADLLFQTFDGALYKAWGYATWKDYVEKELDFGMRNVEHYVSAARWMRRMPEKVQEWARKIGPSKIRLIVTSVTPENAAEWRKKIEGKSFREIEEMVRDKASSGGKGKGKEDDDDNEDPNKAKNMSFKLFPKQHKNVQQAVDVAKGMAESDKPGHALDLIATDFLASNGGIETVQDYLKRVESATGLRLIGYDMAEKAVVFGGKLIDEMNKKNAAEKAPKAK